MRRILLCITIVIIIIRAVLSLSSPTHYLNMMRETKAVSPGLLGLYKFIHHRAIKSSFALKRTEVTNIRKTNAIRTSCSLTFPCFGGRHKTQARKLCKTERAVRRSSNCQAGRNISRFTTLSSNSGIGAPKALLAKNQNCFYLLGWEQPRLLLVFTPIRH